MGLKQQPSLKQFYLLGDEGASRREVDIGIPRDMEDLKYGIGAEYTIVKPEGILTTGIAFQGPGGYLHTVEAVLACEAPIGITVDGNPITDPRGPTGLPLIGNFYEIFPDHLGNHQRLFRKYGPIIRTNNLGRVNYFTNDPEISSIAYLESHGLFTKKTSDSGAPLYGLRDNSALFTCDTETPSFALTHKFVPPSMSPQAVRHYAPLMQESVQSSFPVFDALDQAGLAVNVYQFMVKLSGQLLCKFVLGHDPHHFDAPSSPLHPIMLILGQLLELNKAVQTRGDWYGKLPFGAPKALQHCRLEIASIVDDLIEACPRTNGTHDLPMHEAALQATCLVDYLTRATDSKGAKLPYDLVLTNTLADRLLQELVDAGITHTTVYTPDIVADHNLPFLANFVSEALRLHSPAFQAGRNAKRDMILPGGYKLPQGAVLVPIFPAIHTNPAHWRDPERFDPDRWDTDEVRNRRHRAAYTPFAMGPRGCIGYNYALMQTKVVLCNLVYRYHWENANPAAPVEYDPEFQVIRPLNIYARA
ncbi:hypothetical protein DV735_g2933, partial [Chaetothyriales sp. CBS 134920]